MNSFRTEINIAPQPQKYSLQSTFLTVGSCFAEVMGNKLAYYKTKTQVNPFGTIFNPISLFKILNASGAPEPNFSGALVQRDTNWFAYDLHSSFSAPTEPQLISSINKQLAETGAFLKTANCLILTLGTAVGYIHKASQNLVANCHKIPQNQFTKKLLTVTEITEAFARFRADLLKFNPNIQIIVTVSPVRHLKETLELNSVSKSILRVACHEMAQHYSNISYFPAYELILDDLRDYRFYKPDMLHPSEVAENYIWDKFKTAYLDQAFLDFSAEWDKIQQALSHRPFIPDSAPHQTFLRNILTKLKKLSLVINCEVEIAQVKNQLV